MRLCTYNTIKNNAYTLILFYDIHFYYESENVQYTASSAISLWDIDSPALGDHIVETGKWALTLSHKLNNTLCADIQTKQ